MKDEIGRYTENACSYEELKEIIDSYMVYYNNDGLSVQSGQTFTK